MHRNKTDLEKENIRLEKNRKAREKYSKKTKEDKNIRNKKLRESYRANSSQTDAINTKKRANYNDRSKAEDLYYEEINQVQDNECEICSRISYKDGVSNFKLKNSHIDLFKELDENFKYNEETTIIACHCCIANLRNNKIPCISLSNLLYPGDIPNELEILSDIELTLISKKIYKYFIHSNKIT